MVVEQHVLEAVGAVALAIVVENAMVHVVVLVVTAALEAVLEETYSLFIDERKQSALERRNGEEYNIHRHKGLSIGM